MMSSPKFLLQICPRGGVSVFPEVVYLRSLCRLREMKVFEETVLLVHRTGGRYGQGPLVSVSAKLSDICPRISLSPMCILKCLDDFITLKYHKMIVFIDILLLIFYY
jgi:hypothetical protein